MKWLIIPLKRTYKGGAKNRRLIKSKITKEPWNKEENSMEFNNSPQKKRKKKEKDSKIQLEIIIYVTMWKNNISVDLYGRNELL